MPLRPQRRSVVRAPSHGNPMGRGANGYNGKNGGSPQLTWANIISTLVFGAILIGAFWTVMLTLMSSERERNNLISSYHSKEIELLTTARKEREAFIESVNRERRDLLQQQIDRREFEINRRLVDLATEQQKFVTEREFVQARDQIKVIEQTRPTTGELQAVGNANKDQITKLEERIRSLEENLRPGRRPAIP
jgi:hypothetical protein